MICGPCGTESETCVRDLIPSQRPFSHHTAYNLNVHPLMATSLQFWGGDGSTFLCTGVIFVIFQALGSKSSVREVEKICEQWKEHICPLFFSLSIARVERGQTQIRSWHSCVLCFAQCMCLVGTQVGRRTREDG